MPPSVFGVDNVVRRKEEDMAKQTKCNLIIDSCCDLPYSVVDREGVELLEFPYFIDGEEFKDDMYQTLDPHEFYDKMRAGAQPTTAQVPMQVFQDIFGRAIESGVPTVYLSFTSGLSGSYNTACLVRDTMLAENPGAKLFVVDTKLPSVAEALLVYEAMRQRDNGLSAEEMVAWAEEARYFVCCSFMVDDLESLRRGGRIPSSVAYAGAKLDVKPMLSIDLDGKLTLTGVSRGRKKGIKQLAEFCEKRMVQDTPPVCVVIGNSDCPKDAARLKDQIQKYDENILFLESSIGPVIGSHVGPGMLAVVFWGKDRREDLSVADRIAKRVRNKD